MVAVTFEPAAMTAAAEFFSTLHVDETLLISGRDAVLFRQMAPTAAATAAEVTVSADAVGKPLVSGVVRTRDLERLAGSVEFEGRYARTPSGDVTMGSPAGAGVAVAAGEQCFTVPRRLAAWLAAGSDPHAQVPLGDVTVVDADGVTVMTPTAVRRFTPAVAAGDMQRRWCASSVVRALTSFSADVAVHTDLVWQAVSELADIAVAANQLAEAPPRLPAVTGEVWAGPLDAAAVGSARTVGVSTDAAGLVDPSSPVAVNADDLAEFADLVQAPVSAIVSARAVQLSAETADGTVTTQLAVHRR